MQLRSVRFGTFKSLYDVSCDFDHFTVITGANGAGKSNLADGLDFVAQTYRDGLEIAVMSAGGYDNLAWRRASRARAPISVDVEAEFSADELEASLAHMPSTQRRGISALGKLQFHHSFAFRAKGRAISSEFTVQYDRMSVSNENGPLILVERDEDAGVHVSLGDQINTLLLDKRTSAIPIREVFFPFINKGIVDFLKRGGPPTDLLIRQFGFGSRGLWRLIRSIGYMRVFQLSPQQCRSTGVPAPNASLSRSGDNLPSVAHFLQKHRPESWERIVAAMRAVVPKLEGIHTTHTEDRRLALQFREQYVGRAWNANELSDGTIQAFALFTAIFDGRSPFLVVEEPENSLHPWVLRQFVDLCRSDASKQIIITTHSPVVLDYVPPESLRLMWLRNGKSHYDKLTSLNPLLVEMWKNGEVRVFDTYDSGLLPEAIPMYYSADDPTDEAEER